MKPQVALELLYSLASNFNGGRNQTQARLYRNVLVKALQDNEGSEADAQLLKSMKANLNDAELRILELEEELAKAKKPKRRATRKKNESNNTTTSSVEG